MRNLTLFAILAICLTSLYTIDCAACSASEGSQDDESRGGLRKFWSGNGDMRRQTLMVDGEAREYFLYIPSGPIEYPAPAVFAFHGGGGTARAMDKFTGGITRCADQNHFLIVFPEGISRHWNDGRKVNDHKEDDVAFITRLIESLTGQGKIDGARVYATGISNGGFFSQYLALKLPGRFAGIASVAATLAENHASLMTRTATPVMYILGTEDPLVPFSGGKIGGKLFKKGRGQVLSADRAVRFWLENNGLGESTGQSMVSDTIPSDHTSVLHQHFGVSGSNEEVEVYDIQGGGHTWPRGWQYLPVAIVGRTSQELNANQVIWDFFSRHHL